MTLSPAGGQAKLNQLVEIEGYASLEELLEAAVFDSVSPGICQTIGCDYTTEVEPDQTEGWCEICGKGSVVSALILAGLV